MQTHFELPDAPANTDTRRIALQRTRVAGFNHHAAPRLWSALKRGQRVELQREPENQHDPRAIAVHWEGYKLGYLPRTDNLMLSILMDKGRKIEARLESKRPRADRNEKLRIEIGMVV